MTYIFFLNKCYNPVCPTEKEMFKKPPFIDGVHYDKAPNSAETIVVAFSYLTYI